MAAPAVVVGSSEVVEADEPMEVPESVVQEAPDGPLPPADEDAPIGMSEADEAAYLSEARARGETVQPVAAETIEEVEDKAAALPKLDDLVNRIPSDVRETLDELFRARFVAVRRVPRKLLKK